MYFQLLDTVLDVSYSSVVDVILGPEIALNQIETSTLFFLPAVYSGIPQ